VCFILRFTCSLLSYFTMTEAREADLEKLWLAGRGMTMDDSLNFANPPAVARQPLSRFATSGLCAACKAAEADLEKLWLAA